MQIRPISKLAQTHAVGSPPVLPVAIVSLNSDTARRDILKDRGLPETWLDGYWPATDLRQASADDIRDLTDPVRTEAKYGFTLRPAEVGCAHSHARAFDWLVASDHDFILMLEDDVIPTSPSFETELQALAESVWSMARAGRSFLIHLGPKHGQINMTPRLKVRAGLPGPSALYKQRTPATRMWLTHGYILSKAAARNMLAQNENKIWLLADDFNYRQMSGAIETVYYTKPSIFDQDDTLPSTIQIDPNKGKPPPRPVLPIRLMQRAHTKMRLLRRVIKSFPFYTSLS